MAQFRIGHGYDAHKLVTERKLILGGIHIPCDKGLAGHSDADVLTHAVMDALLGAIAFGDIGKLFPDTNPAYKNANSMELLCRVVAIVTERGYTLGNLDTTIIAQEPKLAPYIPEMRKRLAAVLLTDINNVSVKATTEEGMGFTGEGIGISAHADVLLVETED